MKQGRYDVTQVGETKGTQRPEMLVEQEHREKGKEWCKMMPERSAGERKS